jgi:PAS domain S-box-containing protein
VHSASIGVVVLDQEATACRQPGHGEDVRAPDRGDHRFTGDDLRAPDDHELMFTKLGEVFRAPGDEAEVELRIRHSGAWRWAHAVATNLSDNDAVNGVVVHIRDVTETHDARDALLLNEQQMRALVEYSDNIVEIRDENATITWISPACASVIGWSTEELDGHNAAEFAHPDDLDGVAAAFLEALAARWTPSPGPQPRTKDGTWKWLEACSPTHRRPRRERDHRQLPRHPRAGDGRGGAAVERAAVPVARAVLAHRPTARTFQRLRT